MLIGAASERFVRRDIEVEAEEVEAEEVEAELHEADVAVLRELSQIRAQLEAFAFTFKTYVLLYEPRHGCSAAALTREPPFLLPLGLCNFMNSLTVSPGSGEGPESISLSV